MVRRSSGIPVDGLAQLKQPNIGTLFNVLNRLYGEELKAAEHEGAVGKDSQRGLVLVNGDIEGLLPNEPPAIVAVCARMEKIVKCLDVELDTFGIWQLLPEEIQRIRDLLELQLIDDAKECFLDSLDENTKSITRPSASCRQFLGGFMHAHVQVDEVHKHHAKDESSPAWKEMLKEIEATIIPELVQRAPSGERCRTYPVAAFDFASAR